MGKLIETLQRAGKPTSAAIGFTGRSPAAKSKAAAIAVTATSVDAIPALVKAGADIVCTPPKVDGTSAKEAGAVWGVDLRGSDDVTATTLKELHERGVEFVLMGQATGMRAMSEPIEGLERVLIVAPPAADDPLRMAYRALNLAEVDAAVLDLGIMARDLATMTVERFAQTRALFETLRFPMLVTIADPPASEDVATLARLGAQGVWLATATPDVVTRLREDLERVPREHEAVGTLPKSPLGGGER